jgi:hypothetical protein
MDSGSSLGGIGETMEETGMTFNQTFKGDGPTWQVD